MSFNRYRYRRMVLRGSAFLRLSVAAWMTLALAVVSTGAHADDMESSITAEIAFHQTSPDLLTVHARCVAQTSARLSYRFSAQRAGRSGTSASSQKGEFSVGQGETAELSTVSFNVDHSDVFNFTLQIYHQDRLIAEMHRKFERI